MNIGEKIRVLRENKGLSQQELAARLFVTRAAVPKWERGKGLPAVDSLRLLSRELDISLDDLLSDQASCPICQNKGMPHSTHASIWFR